MSRSIRTLKYLQKEVCKTKIVPVLHFQNAVILLTKLPDKVLDLKEVNNPG